MRPDLWHFYARFTQYNTCDYTKYKTYIDKNTRNLQKVSLLAHQMCWTKALKQNRGIFIPIKNATSLVKSLPGAKEVYRKGVEIDISTTSAI